MRIWSVLGWFALCLVGSNGAVSNLWAQDQFPYTAFLVADDVYVRSGPGRDYYPTMKLSRADAVEVYRHDPGGWLAIRPPEGSFAWVSSRYVEPTEGDLGKVTEENTVARVGSQFSSVRDVIQVRLEKGELIQLLEAVNNGGQTWYKIAPPSGEFRWISSQYIDRRPPHDGVSEPRTEQDLQSAMAGDETVTIASAPAAQSSPRAAVAVQLEADTLAADGLSQAYRPVESDYPVQPVSAEAPVSVSGAASNLQPAAPAQPLGDFFAQLDVLELELSKMSSEEPTVWRFDDLTVRAQMLLNHAQSAIERGRVRNVLHRIAKLEDIKNRYDRIVAYQAETDLENRTLDAAMTAVSGQRMPAATPVGNAASYDAAGLLRPVVSSREGAPRYAVVDDSGEVTAFLSPGPDVNLQPYIGRRIGVVGARGFIPEYQRAHVMVNRVSPLDATMQQ